MTVTDLRPPQAIPAAELEDAQAAYYRRLLFLADDVAHAVRTENGETIQAVLWNALGITDLSQLDPQRAVDLLCALAVQVDVETPMRERAAWTLDVDAINDPPVHQRASIGYEGSGSFGTADGYHERARRRAS